MTKLFYDKVGINNIISDKIDNSLNYLNKIKNLNTQLNVPNNFKYKSYLNEFVSSINSFTETVYAINNKIKTSKKLYEATNSELENILMGIENYSVSNRQSAIK